MAAITIALLASPSVTHEPGALGEGLPPFTSTIGESSDAAAQAIGLQCAVRWGTRFTSTAGACLSCTMLLPMASGSH